MPGEGGVALVLEGLLPGAEEVLADAEAAGDLGDGEPWSVTILTARSLNSAVYVDRGRGIGGLLGLSLHR